MSRFIPVVVAVSLAACHHNTEPQTGAAPAPSDTAVTHQVDPNRTGPPGAAGRSPAGTVNVDSVQVDTGQAKVDSTGAGAPRAAPQDTLGPRSTDSTSRDTTSDTTTAR
jgi:hypothetical protein